MTTPNKQQIIQKARELYAQDCYRNGCPELANVNPEDSELAESGYLSDAKSHLMRDNPKAESAEWNGYNEKLENSSDFQFDLEEAMRTTCFVTGARGCGKSDLAMQISVQLMKEGVIVIAFDPSMDWLKRSKIEKYVTVKPYSELPIPETSMIFDITRLTPMQAQRCVEEFCKRLFESQINNPAKRFFLIFEEAQTHFPLSALSSTRTQNTMRLLTVGRNFGVSLCAISQFPALVSKELIKHAGQLFAGYASEPNTLTYWRGILGKKVEDLKTLQNGQFLYFNRNKITLTQIEPYESEVCKTRIEIPEAQSTEPIKQKEEISAMPFLKLGVLIVFVVLFLYVIGNKGV